MSKSKKQLRIGKGYSCLPSVHKQIAHKAKQAGLKNGGRLLEKTFKPSKLTK